MPESAWYSPPRFTTIILSPWTSNPFMVPGGTSASRAIATRVMASSFHRNRWLRLERRLQRVPPEARALHASGELAHAREHRQLPQRRVCRRPRLPRDHAVELAEQVVDLALRLPLDRVRHHARGRFRDRAPLALEADLGDPIPVHFQVEDNLVAAQRVVPDGLVVRGVQRMVVPGPPAVVEDHFLVQFPQIRHRSPRPAAILRG